MEGGVITIIPLNRYITCMTDNNVSMILDLSSLEKALVRLDEALCAHAGNPTDSLIRDAVIQRFEFNYELATKMLKRYLELAAASPSTIDTMPFPDLIRTASEQGLLASGWDVWMNYRKARGTTSHTYNEQKSLEVLEVVPAFAQEVHFLLQRLLASTQRP